MNIIKTIVGFLKSAGVFGLHIDGGGGGGGSGTSVSYQTNIPEYAQGPYMEMLGEARAISRAPYQPYTGERTAQFTPMMQQAFTASQNRQMAPQIGAASNLSQASALQALSQQYNPSQFLAQQVLPGQISTMPVRSRQLGFERVGAQQVAAPQAQAGSLGFQQVDPTAITNAPQVQAGQLGFQQVGPVSAAMSPDVQAAQMGFGQVGPVRAEAAPEVRSQGLGFERVGAQRVGTDSFAMPGAAQAYMSPYMQNVVEAQQRDLQRQADIARTQRGAQATAAGAFGGSRQAIMEAEAARNLAQQKSDVQAQGLQAAYQQAQTAFMTDEARRLEAQRANQQAGLTAGQLNQQAGITTGQAGLDAYMRAQLANQQVAAQQALANQDAAMKAQMANQQAGLTAGQVNVGTQMQAQQLNQAVAAQRALADQDAAMKAQLANQQAGITTGQAGLDAYMRAQLANQQVGMQAQQLNQDVALRAALANQQAGLTSGQTSLDAYTRTQLANQQAMMQAQQLNQEAGLRASLANQQAGITTGQAGLDAYMRAQLANQQAGLTAGQANLGAVMQAQQLNQQAALEAQRQSEQSRQFGANFANQNLQTALQGAQQLGALGQQQFGQESEMIGQQMQYGGLQQQQIQNILNQQYADFQNAANFPYQQYGFFSDILRGAQGTTRAMYQPPTSTVQALAGLGGMAYGASKLMAKGGAVKAAGLNELALARMKGAA